MHRQVKDVDAFWWLLNVTDREINRRESREFLTFFSMVEHELK